MWLWPGPDDATTWLEKTNLSPAGVKTMVT